MPPWGGFQVLADADPFVEDAPEQVERAQLFHDPVTDFLALDLFGKCAKYAVPDDESSGIISVQIARVGCVVDSMMAWRVHDKFYPARKLANGFSVNPELVNEVNCANKQQHCRMEAQKGQGNAENKTKCNKAGPCLAQRCG